MLTSAEPRAPKRCGPVTCTPRIVWRTLAPVVRVLTPAAGGDAIDGRSVLSTVPALMNELNRTRPVRRTGYFDTLSTLLCSCCLTSAWRISTFSAVSCDVVGGGAMAADDDDGEDAGNWAWRAESSSCKRCIAAVSSAESFCSFSCICEASGVGGVVWPKHGEAQTVRRAPRQHRRVAVDEICVALISASPQVELRQPPRWRAEAAVRSWAERSKTTLDCRWSYRNEYTRRARRRPARRG